MTERWPFLNKAKPFIQENWKASGFQEPTSVQKNAVDFILDGRDVIAESPTGTGKTLAYVLPILEKLEADQKNVQAVILAPSRELVMQIFDVIVEWKKARISEPLPDRRRQCQKAAGKAEKTPAHHCGHTWTRI